MNKRPDTNWVGRALDRVDGPLKVTGQATYAADHRGDLKALIGMIVEADAIGDIVSIDASVAEAADGVHMVLTHENAPRQTPYGTPDDAGRFAMSHAVLEGPNIMYVGQPVAFVVARTLEEARHAARLVKVEIAEREGVFDAGAHEAEAEVPDSLDGGDDADSDTGDFEADFSASDVKFEAEYHTAAQHAAAMEPHATEAEWHGTKLTIHMALQILGDARKAFANTLGIGVPDVRIITPFTGGGFGSKLGIHNEAVLAALAARELGRPVRVAQTRRQLFANGPHRQRHRQRLKIGASSDGTLRAISHESLSARAQRYPFAEAAASPTKASYAAPSIRTRHRVVVADIPKVDSMRAPGEAVGTLTFEAAIDEMAERCGMDPLAFRLLNEPQTDPASGKPFASRTLARCLSEGAKAFGWEDGVVRPKAVRDGNWLVGRGLAAAIRPNLVQPAEAEVVLDRRGRLSVRLDMTDIGTGTYTILTQIAADALGIAPEMVSVELGDSEFPETCGSGGSFGAGSTGTAVANACEALRQQLIERAARVDGDWQGANSQEVAIEEDRVVLGERSLPLGQILDTIGGPVFKASGAIEPGEAHDTHAQYSYGGVFAEVGVDRDTGEIRLRRVLGAFDAGRILNEKTARSQLMGGMIFGIGAALMEESLMDMRYGAFMNRDLAEYHIAVNRDVPNLEIHMVGEPDYLSNPLGSKGIGELGICGTGPAIANAIYAATGYRTREFPIHLDKLLPHLD